MNLIRKTRKSKQFRNPIKTKILRKSRKIKKDNTNKFKNTKIGLEIEMCIKKTKYSKLKKKYNISNNNNLYKKTKYEYDVTCKCKKGYSSSEIISPILTSEFKINNYLNKLFKTKNLKKNF